MLNNDEMDILNRSEVINNLMDIMLVLSKNNEGCTFAIDGKWGVGKTFLLKKLEQELEVQQNELTSDNRYMVFHYNCWKYDYYEEPAISIISSMLEKTQSNTVEKIEKKGKDICKTAKTILENIAGEFLEKNIGVNIVEIYNDVIENGEIREKKEKSFDQYYAFKKTLDLTREKFAQLAKDYTLVLVVDELDRCMPAYAIKVLERLHHMLNSIENVIVVLAFDSTQLEHSIQEIYGSQINVERYMKKFVSFTYKLNSGIVQENIYLKYKEYFDSFEIDEQVKLQIINFIQNEVIDIRSLDQIIRKVSLIHKLTGGEIKDSALLFFEIIWGVVQLKKEYCDIEVREYATNLFWIPSIYKPPHNLNLFIKEDTIKQLRDLREKVKNTKGNTYAQIRETFWMYDELYNHGNESYIKSIFAPVELLNIAKKYINIGLKIW